MSFKTHFDDIPVINFSNCDLKPGTDEWNALKSQVQKALEGIGCFKGLFSKIPPELHKATFGAVEELFALPSETKLLNCSPKLYHGYIGQLPHVPLYESLGFENADILEEAENSTSMLWPDGNPNFSKTMQTFSKHVSEIEKLVKRLVLESLGVEKYYDEIRDLTYYVLRANRYEAPKNTEKSIGLTSHKDLNIISIVFQNHIDGLEIQTKDGDWINVKVSPDTFIVIAGESLHAWTNGRVHFPYHRVTMAENNTRYSVILFSMFKAGYTIDTPEELIDEEHTLLYKPFDYGEYLAFRKRLLDENKRVNNSLKNYCGV